MKRLLTAALLMLVVSPIAAHKASDSFLYWSVDDDRGRLDLSLRDLHQRLDLDRDDDGRITWPEVEDRRAAINGLVSRGLSVSGAGGDCVLATRITGISRHSDGAYVALRLLPACGAAGHASRLSYRLFFADDRLHRALVTVERAGQGSSTVLRPDQRSLTLQPVGMADTFRAFFSQGVIHLWLGLDHVLFLLALLLPSVVYRWRGHWWARRDAGAAIREVAGIVTAFTLAHSLTLAVSALGLFSLPSRLVETLIALSIVLAAVNVFRPLFGGRRYLMGLVFGLVHGFGFAGVLGELISPGVSRLVALGAFNLGVEVAQLAIVIVTVPLLFAIRRAPLYQRLLLPAGTSAIALLGLFWAGQRALF